MLTVSSKTAFEKNHSFIKVWGWSICSLAKKRSMLISKHCVCAWEILVNYWAKLEFKRDWLHRLQPINSTLEYPDFAHKLIIGQKLISDTNYTTDYFQGSLYANKGLLKVLVVETSLKLHLTLSASAIKVAV